MNAFLNTFFKIGKFLYSLILRHTFADIQNIRKILTLYIIKCITLKHLTILELRNIDKLVEDLF